MIPKNSNSDKNTYKLSFKSIPKIIILSILNIFVTLKFIESTQAHI